jgi:Ca-activated chloride channel family protein
MTFLFPAALLALLLVPLLAFLYVVAQRRRHRYAVRYASLSLVRDAVGRGPGIRRHVPAALFLLAVACGAIALARPQLTLPVHQDQGIVMLSVDVSGSMVADDVKPNRIAALQDAARSFIQQQPDGVMIGLVSFNADASLLQPPTQDRTAVLRSLDQLHAAGGTNIGGGLRVALDAIYRATDIARPSTTNPGQPSDAGQQPPQQAPASIVLVSDGGSNAGPPPLDVAREAAAAGVRVYTVGIGTAQGTVLHIQGESVLTRLDEPTLQGVASATGAQYFNAQTESQLSSVYSDLARQQQVEDKTVEVTYLAASGALALMVAGALLSLLWFNRFP